MQPVGRAFWPGPMLHLHTMDSRPLNEQRQSFRCNVADARRSAELRIGNERYRVMLLDESAGGFAVLMDRQPAAAADGPVELTTDAGDFEVRIAHVVQTELPGAGPASDAEPQRRYRVGLVRVRDIDPFDRIADAGVATQLRFALGSVFPKLGVPMIPGVALAILLAISLTVLALLFPVAGALPVDQGRTPRTQDRDFTGRSRPEFTPNEPRTAAGHVQQAGGHRGGAGSGTGGLQALARGVSGAAVFTMPEMIDAFGLSPHQQEKMASIVQLTAEALAAFSAASVGYDRARRAAERQAILDAARDSALAVLNDDQKSRWRELNEP